MAIGTPSLLFNGTKTATATTYTSNALGSNIPVGSTLIVIVRTGGGQSVTSISDTKSNTWGSADAQTASPTASNLAVYSTNVTVALASTDTITVTYGSSSNCTMTVLVVTGIIAATSRRLDQANWSYTTNAVLQFPASGSIATSALSNVGELVIAAIGVSITQPSAISASSGYTALVNTGFSGCWHKSAGTSLAAQSVSFTWTSASANAAAAIVTYRPTNMAAMFATLEG